MDDVVVANRPQSELFARIPSQSSSTTDRLSALRSELDCHPNDGRLIEAFAETLLSAGRLDESLVYANRLKSLRPDVSAPHLLAAKIYQAKGMSSQVEKCLMNAVAAEPADHLANFTLATHYEKLKKFEQALACFLRVVELKPDHSEAFFQIGTIHRRWGDLRRAREYFTQAQTTARPTAKIANAIGATFAEQQRFEQAIPEFQRAVELAPDWVETKINLAVAHLQNQQGAKALEMLEALSQQAPMHKGVQIALAKPYLDQKKLDRVIAVCEQFKDNNEHAVTILAIRGRVHHLCRQHAQAVDYYTLSLKGDPHQPDTLFYLAELLTEEKNVDGAIQTLRKVISLDPTRDQAFQLLGRLLLSQGTSGQRRRGLPIDPVGCLTEAKCYLQRAVQLKETAESYGLLGKAHYHLREDKESEHCFRAALDLDPQNAKFLDDFGNSLLERGLIDDATELFQKAIAIDPKLAKAHFHLSKTAVKGEVSENRIDELTKLLEEETDLPSQRSLLEFALARYLELANRDDEAFEHYCSANAVKPRPNGAERHDDHLTDRVQKVFTKAAIRAWQQSENAGDGLIFIVGMPRSGTTLTEQILASHPSVFGAGELKDMIHCTQAITRENPMDLSYPEAMESSSPELLSRLAKSYLRTVREKRGDAAFVVDKMPTNFMHLGLIATLFPQAKIIHCIRHPLDTMLSCFKQNLDWPFCSLPDLGQYYNRYLHIMDHWKEHLPCEIYESRYEDLVSDQEQGTAELLKFCGLPWDERCLEFFNSSRTVGTPSKWQVRQPIYRTSINSWVRYRTQLLPLIEQLDRDLLRQHGWDLE